MTALEGASKYLNNLLLARGLLQNGKSIEFAYPEDGKDGTDATMSKIINLVHDLVLRRDRESDRYESMAESIRNLRISESQHILNIQQMQDKHQQLRNDCATSQAQERAARASLKKVEFQVKELKDQNVKMKSMLDQVRAKCTSDVRKRDTEIEKLKSHLISVQRGKKETSHMKINTFNIHTSNASRGQLGAQEINDPGWSLEKETNDFLAAIVNETSAENVSLRQVVGDTLTILKDMSGYEEDTKAEEDDGIGIPGQYRKSRQQASGTIVPVHVLDEQMNNVLDHCRTILRDPSFVPIEEVQVREDEIAKLRIGWEKMADRWKEAVTMMSQWKQRMMSEGRQIDIDEFSDLSFGRSIAVRPDGQPVLSHDTDLSSIFEESRVEETGASTIEDQESGETNEEEVLESDLELAPEPAFKRLASSPARRGVRLPKPTQILSEIGANSLTTRSNKSSLQPSTFCGGDDVENDVPEKLTVLQKLAAVEAEAAVAGERQHQQTSRKRKAQQNVGLGRRSGRRRSTLSPEELAALMVAH